MVDRIARRQQCCFMVRRPALSQYGLALLVLADIIHAITNPLFFLPAGMRIADEPEVHMQPRNTYLQLEVTSCHIESYMYG